MGVNFHVAQGNLAAFLEETQQKVVTPAVIVIRSLNRKRCLQGAELLWRCGLLCVQGWEEAAGRPQIPKEMGLAHGGPSPPHPLWVCRKPLWSSPSQTGETTY